MASLLFPPGYQILDSNGNPASGALVTVYDAGTTDKASIYDDLALSSAHSNPVTADSAGRLANIYVNDGQNYKVVATTSGGTALFTSDDIPPFISNATGTLAVNAGGTGATTASGARTNLGAAAASDVTTLSSNLSSATTAQSTATWEAGAGTTETTVSPAKVKASIVANEAQQSGNPDCIIYEEQSAGTNAGDFNSGSWVTRTLNDKEDANSICTLSSNTMTFTKDGYVRWSAPAHGVNDHKTRLYNTTDAVVVSPYGTTERSNSGSPSTQRSFGFAFVEAGKAYRIEHRCSSSQSGDGLGRAAGFSTPEVYTVVEFFSAHRE